MNIALLTAAGTGTRTNFEIPKQFIHINNKPLILYTMQAFQMHPDIDEICIVILAGWEKVLEAYVRQFKITKVKYIVPGGSSNHESIYNGLKSIKKVRKDEDVIVIHDGNRAMVEQDIITDALVTFHKYGSAVAAVPCTEVVYQSEEGLKGDRSLDRKKLWRTQTPHVYALGELLQVHEAYLEKGYNQEIPASCSLMEMFGKHSYFSKGSEKNIKITTVDDLDIFKALLKQKEHDMGLL